MERYQGAVVVQVAKIMRFDFCLDRH